MGRMSASKSSRLLTRLIQMDLKLHDEVSADSWMYICRMSERPEGLSCALWSGVRTRGCSSAPVFELGIAIQSFAVGEWDVV